MPACPSAPCFSPKATGSVPLLRDLLSDADVTRLHTLRPAPPVPGLYAALCRRVPWPDVSRALPCNALPALPGTTAQAPFASLPDLPAGSLEGLRLGYVLFSLPWPDAVSLLRACALAARQLWLADFILAERNLGLPAALLRRLLPGFLPWGPATPARIWLRRGGLEGCLRDAGLAAAQRRTLLAGAAALIPGWRPSGCRRRHVRRAPDTFWTEQVAPPKDRRSSPPWRKAGRHRRYLR